MAMMTSAEANKQLKILNENRRTLLKQIDRDSTFVAAIEENKDDARPDFNFGESFFALAVTEKKIALLKEAIFSFNRTHTIRFSIFGSENERDYTVSEALTLLPMLNERVNLLKRLAETPEKERIRNMGSKYIEYRYANYSREEAAKKYLELNDELVRLQVELDKVNQGDTFEVDI